MYDIIIIGAGPAGMTAAIYAARKKLKTVVVTKDIGGQMVWSSDVENYTGYSMVSGAELALKFREHLDHVGSDLEVKEGVEVTGVEKNVTIFTVETKTIGPLYAKAVIIASGKNPRHLGIPGEEQHYGKGVAVCATCDAPLYKGKDVAVVGGGNSALDALLALSRVANKIYSVNINEQLSGDAVLRGKVESAANITFLNSTKAVAVVGEVGVTGLRVQKQSGEISLLPVSGVFVEIGYVPSTDFVSLVEKNDRGEIQVNNNLETTVSGLFCAGDANDAWGEQIIIAAGEGAKAALAASNYINQLK